MVAEEANKKEKGAIFDFAAFLTKPKTCG